MSVKIKSTGFVMTLCTLMLVGRALSVGVEQTNSTTTNSYSNNQRLLPILDVRHDMTALGIFERNAQTDGTTDSTEVLQAAIDHLSTRGGGTVLVPAGVYRLTELLLVDGVSLVGDGPDKTIFRSLKNTASLIKMTGGNLLNCTLYGTDEAGSGPNWKVGGKGEGAGGTAKPVVCIRVDAGTNSVTIYNVYAYEARYDPLYVRDCGALRVLKCRFDRAGRNVASLVGNTDDFIFSDCYFGSLWGLYHVDIEPNDGKWVRNGLFINCVFDGSRAGEMGTTTWGAFLGFCGDRAEGLRSRNVTVKNCHFKDIWIRVQGVFPEVQFLENQFDLSGAAFIKVRTNKVGEFRDAVVRGNRFPNLNEHTKSVVSGATFTGNTLVEGNEPATANAITISEKSKDLTWEEIHPITQATDKSEKEQESIAKDQIVTMPLQGHEFRFSDGQVFPATRMADTDNDADLCMHIDPLIAKGDAGIQLLGDLTQKDVKSVPTAGYFRQLFGASVGDVYAVKTREGKYVVMTIMAYSTKQIQFHYRFVGEED